MADEKHLGKVTKIMGCMFSGKSTELMRLVKRSEYGGVRVQVFTPKADTRSPKNSVESRDFGTRQAIEIENVFEIFTLLDPTTLLVAIDEVQFLPNIAEFCQQACLIGLDVIISGLDYTYEGKPFRIEGFGCILDIPAEETITLKAVCMQRGCGKDAIYTERTVKSKKLKIVGSTENYRAVCRQHMGQFKPKTPTKIDPSLSNF